MKSQANAEKRELQEVQVLDAQTQHSALSTQHYLWLIGCFLVTAVAVFWRFWQLELKPLHHDEGVNGYFLVTLFREGVYKYDPSNYHGPTLYYISLAFTKLFGLETFWIRASVAIFGVSIVVLTLFLRRYLGTIGSLFAALLLALSPGMVFISRYFIHEIFFVFCSLGIVAGILFFVEKRKPGVFALGASALLLLVYFLSAAVNLAAIVYQTNTPSTLLSRVIFLALALILIVLTVMLAREKNPGIYLLLSSAALSLFFATKETAFITVGTMLIAVGCVWLWRRIYGGVFSAVKPDNLAPTELTWTNFRRSFGDANNALLLIGGAFLFFAYVGVVLFSSFFTYWEGVVGAFKAYAFWTKTGSADHTQNGFAAYAKWLWRVEAPILLLAALGSLIALLKARHRFAIFTAFWAFGLFAAYTIIPYKTPWLALSFTLPMCIVAGYGMNELAAGRNLLQKAFAGVLAAAAAGILGYQTYQLNFVRYDDDKMPYVYAHTQRGFLDLIGKIEYYAEKSGKKKDATVQIVSPDYWGMPWYTREYPKANYFGKIVPANSAEMIVSKKGEQDEEIRTEYTSHYKYAGTYPLRPGVELVLLVRWDIADNDTKNLFDPELNDFSAEDLKTVPSAEENKIR